MKQVGGCHCGAIRYEVSGEPVHNALCYCNDCRRSAGAPTVHWTLFPKEAVSVTGTPAKYESSPGTTRQFCARCGTGLFYLNEAIFPGQIDVQAATLDDPSALPPQACVQLADAPTWLGSEASLPHFERYPE